MRMYVAVCVCAIVVQTQTCWSSVSEVSSFSFASFSPESCRKGEVVCMGSVRSGEGHLSLTSQFMMNSSWRNQIGRVLYPQRVGAWPAFITTTFTLRITTLPNSTTSGDGVTFVLAEHLSPSPPGSFGAYLGLFDRSTQGGSLRQMGVELDTFMNEFDPDGNHIAIDTTSITSPVAVASLNGTGVDLKSGRDIEVKIDYDGSSEMLCVSVGYSRTHLKSILNHSIALSNIVPSTVYVGFTASTGSTFPQSHQILNWVFTSVPLPMPSLKGGTGRTILIVVIPVFVVVLVISIPFIWEAVKKRDHERGENKAEDVESLSRTAADIPKEFSFKQLSKATNNFSKENLLGRGGFGSVYKGVLSNPSKTMAVKKISATSKQGEREYFAEICTIGRVRHKNIVHLQGWCHEGDHLLLVYEYMENGSLDRFIGKDILNWQTRHKILIGLASALLYLHEECGNPVVHRDVKPNNIMLDSNYNAHLGDFGLARLLQNEESVITNFAGTPGYLAPEVGFTGKATPESDVYSYGMVVLEMVCGRRSKSVLEENSLVDYVWNMHVGDTLIKCVDILLRDEFDKEEARRALMVGLACLHSDSVLRPKMRKVVHILLNPNEPLMELPRIRPAGIYVTVSPSTSSTNFGSRSAYQYPLLQSPITSSDEISIVYE